MKPIATIEMIVGRKKTVRRSVRPRNQGALSTVAKRNARRTVRGTVATVKMSVLRRAGPKAEACSSSW